MPGLLLFLLACPTTTPKDDSAGGDTALDTHDSPTGPTCDTMNSGTDWKWEGECPQMRTPCDIVVTECELAIDYDADGGMTMGMPYAGTIDGNTITFEDGDILSGCVGTLIDADHAEGTCDTGCTWELSR